MLNAADRVHDCCIDYRHSPPVYNLKYQFKLFATLLVRNSDRVLHLGQNKDEKKKNGKYSTISLYKSSTNKEVIVQSSNNSTANISIVHQFYFIVNWHFMRPTRKIIALV